MKGFKIPIAITPNFLSENTPKKMSDSIDNFIELIVASPNGSFKADFGFGFVFQNFRYVSTDANAQIGRKNLSGLSSNRNNYAYYLKRTIEEYELRLSEVEVNMGYQSKTKTVTLDIWGIYEEDYVKKNYAKNISFIIW
jgi:hypothetical protein